MYIISIYHIPNIDKYVVNITNMIYRNNICNINPFKKEIKNDERTRKKNGRV